MQASSIALGHGVLQAEAQASVGQAWRNDLQMAFFGISQKADSVTRSAQQQLTDRHGSAERCGNERREILVAPDFAQIAKNDRADR
jgi:hypothetical protein